MSNCAGRWRWRRAGVRLPRSTLLPLAVDLALVLLAGWIAFWLRFNFDVPAEFEQLALRASPWSLAGYAAALTMAGVYRQVWSYIGLPELRQLGAGIMLGGLLTAAAVLMQRMPDFPRSVLLLQPLIALILLGAARAGWRTVVERRTLGHAGGRRLLIVGSLQDASDALRALKLEFPKTTPERARELAEARAQLLKARG